MDATVLCENILQLMKSGRFEADPIGEPFKKVLSTWADELLQRIPFWVQADNHWDFAALADRFKDSHPLVSEAYRLKAKMAELQEEMYQLRSKWI